MSARVVAVTTLLLDVLEELAGKNNLTPSEADLLDLLYLGMADLKRIKATAVTEMQALAPAVLAADAAWVDLR